MTGQEQQDRMARIRMARMYCEGLEDETLRVVCFLLSRGLCEKEIRRRMSMKKKRLELVKLAIAIGLRAAGVRPKGEVD